MIVYILRRLLYTIPIVIGVLLLTFLLFTVVGGDISQQIAGKNASVETIIEIRHERGFDKPLFFGYKPLEDDVWHAPADPNELIQYVKEGDGRPVIFTAYQAYLAKSRAEQKWLGGLFWKRAASGKIGKAWNMLNWDSQFLNHFKDALTFHFGRALDNEKISDKIKRGVGPSLSLTVPMFIGTLLVSISLSLLVAFVRGTWVDVFIVIFCIAGMSVPYLSFIIFGQYFFAYKWGFFPIMYMPEESMTYSLALPILIGIIAGLGSNLRFYRTVMLDEMRSDHVRTAFAKGLSTPKVLFKHVLKNAMIPILTNVVLVIPFLVLGSFLLERFFGIPGLGSLMLEAFAARDYSIINAMTFILALLICFFTVLTDICYALVDPRIKFD